MSVKVLLREALKGSVGGAVAGLLLLLVGVLRALFAMFTGVPVDWSADTRLFVGYVGAIAMVGAIGRPLWVLRNDRYSRLLASMVAGAAGGAVIFRLATPGDSDPLPDLIGVLYGALMGCAFWAGGNERSRKEG